MAEVVWLKESGNCSTQFCHLRPCTKAEEGRCHRVSLVQNHSPKAAISQALDAYKPGDVVTLSVQRILGDGRITQLDVQIKLQGAEAA